MTGAIAGVDRFRTELGHRLDKEWQHFVVHGEDARLIVNFSISTAESPVARRLGRLIVLTHHDRFEGAIEEYDLEDVAVGHSGVRAEFGPNRLWFDGAAYGIDLHLPHRNVQGRLHLVPQSRPFMRSNQPLGSARMSWLFVPRLSASGWIRFGDVRFSMRDAVAYHDHNWGPFRWGDDFGWQWGSALPHDRSNPWSMVFMRMTDRAHTRAKSQCLYVWHAGEPAAMFRDRAVHLRTAGHLRQPPATTLPGVMRLLDPGTASDIPQRLVLEARRGDDELTLTITPEEYARVVIPAEKGPRPTVALHEVAGRFRAVGTVAGHDMNTEGSGVFEYLR